jgi:hypothetical protein
MSGDSMAERCLSGHDAHCTPQDGTGMKERPNEVAPGG